MTLRTAVATFLAALLFAGCGRHALEQTETKAAVPVSVETAVKGTMESTISATGVVQPAPGGDMTITAPEGARIAELPKAEGDPVAVGDLLVRFDIPSLPADVEAKRAAVNAARAQLTSATADLNRKKPLVAQGVVAQRDVEEAQRAVEEATAALAQAESAVSAANALAGRSVVRARFPGVVAKRWHSPGDMVEGAASDPVLRVIDPRALQIFASIPASAAARGAVGHTAFAIGPSGEGEPVKLLTAPAAVDTATSMAEVRLAFTKPTKITPGTPVQIVIIAESHENAVMIPAAAVVHDDDEVFVMVIDKDNKAHRHDVVLGLTSAEKVEILSGIAPGDVVVYRGQDELPDGATVTIVK